MQFIKRISVGMFIGTVLGLTLGILLAFVFAPRHWVTIPWITNTAPHAASAGAASGVLIGTVNWLFCRKAVGEKISTMIELALTDNTPQTIWGIIDGVVLGSIGGVVIEAAVDVGRLLLSPNGKLFFLASDFSPVLFVSPILGAIVGAIYRHTREHTHKAANELRGIGSGAVFGASASILWIVSTCWWIPLTTSSQITGYGYMTAEVAIGAMVLGILVGVAIEMILNVSQHHQASPPTSSRSSGG